VILSDTRVEWRTDTGAHDAPLTELGARSLRSATPWRTVRSFRGRPHYAGWYWSATTKGFVTYESRLELSCLLLADQNESVTWIVSQPFLLTGADPDLGRRRRHVPDFAFIDRHDAVTVTNVKPLDRLSDERVRSALDWAGTTLAERGWRHEIWTGVDPVRLANVRFLSSYRIADRCSVDALRLVRSTAVEPMSVGELEGRCVHALPAALVRPALLHQIWMGSLVVDLGQPLDRHSQVRPRRSVEVGTA
jgi:hypothetical protein